MDYKDICVPDRQLPIHQLNKLNIKGTKREDIFPISVIQAIFDKTGIRLDTIISSFNYIFLPYKGTIEDTRLQVVGLMRRKSLVVCYRDLNNKTIIEMYNSDERGDEAWKDSSNWIDFGDYIAEVVKEIMGNLDDYPDIYDMIKEAISGALVDTVNQWLTENIDSYITEHLQDYDFSTEINNLFNKYITGDDFSTKLTTVVNNYLKSIDLDTIAETYVEQYFSEHPIGEDYIKSVIEAYVKSDDFIQFFNSYIDSAVNTYLQENLEPLVGEFFTAVVKYIGDNERVIANALARHEQAITDLQNT